LSALKKKLRTLGLTENECKAYFAVLKLGACTAVEVSRESRLQRTEIYPLMSELVSKGLVEETIDRPKRYRPVDVKHALPRLAMRIRDRLDRIAKESEQLATRLEAFSTKAKQTVQEEVRIIYGPQSARVHMLESIKSAEAEFWGMAGRRRPPHISDRLLLEALRLITSKGLKARLIIEVDKENLNRVRKMAAAAEIAHYQPIPAYMYGMDNRAVAVSLVEEPIGRASETSQLVTTYRPTVQIMRQFFNILWRESTPFALREAILLGHRPSGETSRTMRGREEAYIQSENVIDYAKDSIRAYIPTRYGPVRLLKRFNETYLRAHRRGVKIRIICRLSDDNVRAVKTLAKFIQIRHTDNPIGFSMGIVDDLNAAIYYTDPDSVELESRTDYMIRITNEQGVRHLRSLFEALWEESMPIEGLLQKYERPLVQ
jgi:sugar-specific transcriptional regulator TrmB